MNLPENAPLFLWMLAILAPVASSIATAFFMYRGRRQEREDIGEVKEHVSNNHRTNLRDDLDAIHSDIRGLRDDIALERRTNRESREEAQRFEHRVREAFRFTHPEVIL